MVSGSCGRVIPTRIDLDKIINDNTQVAVNVPLESEIPTIMMISSFDGTKARSIAQVISAIESLLVNEGLFVKMTFIGGSGIYYDELKNKAQSINSRVDREIFYFTGPVVDAYYLLKHATIVLGVGRSAFEGMAYGKPTIVVGANGFAGVVCKENIEELSYYNFSGRNQKSLLAPEVLVIEIKKLLSEQ